MKPDARFGKQKMGEQRRPSAIANGSCAAGHPMPPLANPRLSISFPPDLFQRLKMEAIDGRVAVGEIVRRRLLRSYR